MSVANEAIHGMRRTAILALALTASFVLAAARATAMQVGAGETLTNEAVLKMAEAKVGDSLIVAKIKASHCEFQTSVEDIVKLKGAGVSDPVIQAMVETGAAEAPTSTATPPSSPAPAAPDPNDPRSPHDSGIYWLSKEPMKEMIELEPTVYSGGETSGTFAAVVTYGIHKIAVKAVVHGNRANQRIDENQPEFWFYFEEPYGYFGPDPFWHSVTSPNEFVLAKLDAKKAERDLVVGEVGTFGSSAGPRSKDTIAFRTEKIASGVYQVIPNGPLSPGEYCFFYGGVEGGRGGGKLFDFGVDAAAGGKK